MRIDQPHLDCLKLKAERDHYRAALEHIAGPPDKPNLTRDGKVAIRALDREPATPEAIADRARRDCDHYVNSIPLLAPQHKAVR